MILVALTFNLDFDRGRRSTYSECLCVTPLIQCTRIFKNFTLVLLADLTWSWFLMIKTAVSRAASKVEACAAENK